jgi:TPR repeat protein
MTSSYSSIFKYKIASASINPLYQATESFENKLAANKELFVPQEVAGSIKDTNAAFLLLEKSSSSSSSSLSSRFQSITLENSDSVSDVSIMNKTL